MAREYELAFRMNAELESRFNRTFSQAGERITELERKLRGLDRIGGDGRFGRGITDSLRNIGRTAGIAAGAAVAGGVLAAGYAVGSSIEKAMNFESQMSTIQALTGATSAETAKMQALALKMGAATKYSAMEAAQGIEELLKAGLTPAAVQTGGLEAALNLATAGGLELASAAEIMSTALNAFKKDGMTAADASNILSGTAGASATSVEDLRYSLAAVSAVAAGAGMNFRDTNTALGLFANNGLKGSDAGTSLKTMLSNLQPTTKAQIKQFEKLGLLTKEGSNAFYDAGGYIKSLENISGTLRKQLKNLTNQERMLALETMFGSDAIRAANILYEEGAEGVQKFQKEMSKVTALDVAKKKMDNAAGAVEQFKGAIETLQISALLPTMPIIKDLATAAADFVTKYTPQITSAVQDAVDMARKYIRTRFIDNPEFKKLPTLRSKIDFVFNDLMATFNKWFDGGGKQAMTKATAKIVDAMATGISMVTPTIIQLGTDIGLGIGKGVIVGLGNALTDRMNLDYLNKSADMLNKLSIPGAAKAGIEKLWSWTFSANPGGKPADGGYSEIRGYASGGYVNRPEIAWIGEGRSPEWVIPDNNAPRSRSLLQAANKSMGYGSAGGDFNFSPTYNFYGNADKSAVESMERRTRSDFAREFEAWKAEQRRVSMG